MKGLIIKDMKLMTKNKMATVSLLFILIIFVMLTGKDQRYSFAVGYVTMLAGIYASSTISIDENGGSMPFLMTLPVTRKVYVAEKYLFVIVSCLISCILTMMGFIIAHTDQWETIIAQGIVIFVVMSFYYIIMLPLQIKYNDKSRIALLGLIMFCIAAVAVYKQASSYINTANMWLDLGAVKNLVVKIINGIFSLNKIFVVIVALLIWLICWGVSFCISLEIMRRKEF